MALVIWRGRKEGNLLRLHISEGRLGNQQQLQCDIVSRQEGHRPPSNISWQAQHPMLLRSEPLQRVLTNQPYLILTLLVYIPQQSPCTPLAFPSHIKATLCSKVKADTHFSSSPLTWLANAKSPIIASEIRHCLSKNCPSMSHTQTHNYIHPHLHPKYNPITWSHQPTSHGFAQVSQKKSTKGIFCSPPKGGRDSLSCPPTGSPLSPGGMLICSAPFPWCLQERKRLISKSCFLHEWTWAWLGSCWPTCPARGPSHLCCSSLVPPQTACGWGRHAGYARGSPTSLQMRMDVPTVQRRFSHKQNTTPQFLACTPYTPITSSVPGRGRGERSNTGGEKKDEDSSRLDHWKEEQFLPGGGGRRFPAISGYHMAAIQLTRQKLHC